MHSTQVISRGDQFGWYWPDPFARDNQRLKSRALSKSCETQQSLHKLQLNRHPSPLSETPELPVLRIDLDPACPIINISVEDLENTYSEDLVENSTCTSPPGGPPAAPQDCKTIAPRPYTHISNWQAPNEWSYPSKATKVMIEAHQADLNVWSLDESPEQTATTTEVNRKRPRAVVLGVRRASATINTFFQTHLPKASLLPSRLKDSRAISPWALHNASTTVPNPVEFQTILQSLSLTINDHHTNVQSSLISMEFWILEEISWRLKRGLSRITLRDEVVTRYFSLIPAKRLILRSRIKERLLDRGWKSVLTEGEWHGERKIDISLVVAGIR